MAVYDELKAQAVERELSLAGMTRPMIEAGVAWARTPTIPLGVDGGDGAPHLLFFAPTRWGKSTVINEYVIPWLGRGRRTVVLTSVDSDIRKIYRDGFEVVPLGSRRKFPTFDNDLFQTIKGLQFEPEIEAEVNRAVEAVAASRRPKVLVAVTAPDSGVNKWRVNSFITEMVGRQWGGRGLLLVVEDAFKYKCEELVGSGRKSGIVAVLATIKMPDEDTLRNTRIVLGPVGAGTATRIDPTIVAISKRLGRGEFLWQYSAGRWARFRHEKRREARKR
jgi:hypothetical protein